MSVHFWLPVHSKAKSSLYARIEGYRESLHVLHSYRHVHCKLWFKQVIELQ